MNAQQFESWWLDYAAKFPSVAVWLEKLAEKLGDSAADGQLSIWRETLAEVPLRDALRISHAMAVGDLEPIGTYDSDRESTARIIKRAWLATRPAEKKRRDPTPPPRSSKRLKGVRPIWEAVEQVERLIRSGRTRGEALNEVCGGEGFEPDDFYGRRYCCPVCEDEGLVQVWSYRAMKAARDDPELLESPGFCSPEVAPCDCREGRKRVWLGDSLPPRKWSGWTSESALYSEDRYFRWNGGGEEQREDFVQWATAYWDRVEAGRVAQLAMNDEPPPERTLFDGNHEDDGTARPGEF